MNVVVKKEEDPVQKPQSQIGCHFREAPRYRVQPSTGGCNHYYCRHTRMTRHTPSPQGVLETTILCLSEFPPHLTWSPHILPEDIPVGLIERSYVRHEAACKHAIPNQRRGAVPEFFDLVTPPFVLARQTTHQTLSERKTGKTSRRLCFHLSLLFCCLYTGRTSRR